jgi:glycosyltransferase involved in cell wall biosynthesis
VSKGGQEVERAPERERRAIASPLRSAAVGVSTSRTCGVHDHAALLAAALETEDVSCALHWLWRDDETSGASRSSIRAWTRGLAAELDREPLDAVLVHYSVFAYSYRGLPVFVRPLLAALRSRRVPIVTALHELAYPWRRDGLRGTAWAITQRAILFEVLRASAGIVVTASFRADWLESRRWLAHRRTVVAPVFSNLPVPSAGSGPAGRGPVVGLFGYGHTGAAVSLVLDAIGLLARRGEPVQLMLLGAPGRSSPAGGAWVQAAHARELAGALVFSDTLPAQELSDALASCDVLLSAEPAGPTSRKTTLAASLASGRPVVAIDGARRWAELVDAQAAIVVEPSPAALADALAALLGDEHAREEVGARGRAFAEQNMSVQRSARVVAGLLDDVVRANAS